MHTMTPFNPYSGPAVQTWMVWPNGVAVKLDKGLPHGVAGDATWRLITASTEAEALMLAAERRRAGAAAPAICESFADEGGAA